MEHNILVVAQGVDHPALYKRGLRASRLHWISGHAPSPPFVCTARIRHQQPLQPCTLVSLAGQDGSVEFERPQRAITAGQSVVFYRGDECLGGGIIEAAMDL
jgi:tRNA-specific 2-thiouridylase